MRSEQLSSTERNRYARHLLLPELSEGGQSRIRESKVLVVGAGGLGSPVLVYLAAAGVGKIGIVDDDKVEDTNLARQVIHSLTSNGQLKVASAAQRLEDLAGDLVEFETFPFRLSRDNAAGVFENYDLIIDATDNFNARYLISDVAAELGKTLVWGAVLGFDAQVSVFTNGLTLRDVFPTQPPEGSVPVGAGSPVFGPLVGQAGTIMAMEALKVVGGFGNALIGRLLVIDSLRATFSEIPIRARK